MWHMIRGQANVRIESAGAQILSDKDFPTFDSSEEDELPRVLREDQAGTETIDLGLLLTRDVTSSGSFGIGGAIRGTTFGKLTQALPIPALLIDQSHNVIVANQACGRIGPGYEKILGTLFSSVFPDPSHAQEAQAALEKVFSTRKPQIFEGMIRIGEGRIWGRVTLRSIRMMDSRLVLVLVEDLSPEKKQLALKHKLNEELRQEIARRERAEREVAQSEKKYRQFVETASDIIYRTDPNGLFTIVNQVGLRITEYSAEQLIGRNYLELIRADHKKAVERFYGTQFLKRRPVTYLEFPIITKRGKTVWLGQNVQLLTEGDTIAGFQAIARDITERKEAEDRFSETLARLDALVNAIPDIVSFKDLEGRNLVVNKAFEAFIGLSRQKIVGKTDAQILPKDFADHCRRQDEQVIESGKPINQDCSAASQNGETLFLEVTKFPIFDDAGKVVGLGGLGRDVTERRRLEEQLGQAAKMEAIGTLAGGLAHDFNNLLQIILGYSDVLLLAKEKNDPEVKRIESIRAAARRGADLVKRILTFSRKAETKPRPINLNHQLMQVEDLLHRTIPKMIGIKLRLAENLQTINADPAQVEQIILNLAVNAKHAMPEGGELILETKNVVLDEVMVSTLPEVEPGNYVMLSVSDTGHGMEKEILDRIFDPFFTTKKMGEGTGLGLSTVFGIVKSHHGHITCDSEPGAGSTFRIYFPAMEREIEWNPATTLQMPAFGTETVLLVDDEESIRELGKELLTGAGYTVLTASTGQEALDVYRRDMEAISLIILDLVMPRMGGKQCLQELLKVDPNVKVLVASGYAESDLANEVMVGAKGFVRKPYNMKELFGALRRILDSD
jgi:two-component system, cell cycle sensor histidine kinase and response regulator CckA